MDHHFKVFPMAKEHIDRLLEIEAICFHPGWSRHTLNAIVEDENSLFLTGFVGDTVIGYGGVHFVLDECNLDNICIHPSFQGQGYGEELLKQLIILMKKKKMAVMMLEVRQSNKTAIKLYDKMGFVQVGKRENYYTDPVEAAVLMNLELLEKEEKK